MQHGQQVSMDHLYDLLREIQELVRLNFFSFRCAYAQRQCNRIADALAALGRECGEEENCILSSLPNCIQSLLAEDSSVNE